MDRLTEVLRQKDMEKLMQCVQQLLEYGAAVILLDLDETFMFRSSDRIDVVKNRQTCYHLYPEEYGEKLYKILGWEDHGSVGKQTGPCSGDVVLRVSGLTFPGTAPLDLQISGGEIAFLRDENYSTAMQLQSCFLGGQRWLARQLLPGWDGIYPRRADWSDRYGDRHPDRAAGPLQRCAV